MAIMKPGTRKILRFLGNWIINAASVALTVIILRNHISYGDKPENLLVAALLLGVLNAFVRPILMIFALPLVILTLGLFYFVINALLLCLLSLLLPFFHVDGFGYAFLGALLISVISLVLNSLTGNSPLSFYHRFGPPPPPPRRKDDGNGPVIDV